MTNLHKMLEYFTNLCYHLIRNKNGKKFKGDGMIMGKNKNKSLEDFSLQILEKNDMLKVPVDLIAIAKNNKIEVYQTELPDEISGAIRYDKQTSKFQILLNQKESYVRRRFTLAHELAHFFLEREKLQQEENIHFDTMYRKIKNPDEKNVEYLAGALLMNESILRDLYEINPSIKFLSNIFRVSESAVTVRLMKLGIK